MRLYCIFCNKTQYIVFMWNEEKVKILKDLWGKGKTANIAEIIGGITETQ